jgi:hypothetical protein
MSHQYLSNINCHIVHTHSLRPHDFHAPFLNHTVDRCKAKIKELINRPVCPHKRDNGELAIYSAMSCELN